MGKMKFLIDMRKCILLACVVFASISGLTQNNTKQSLQKPPVAFEDFGKWPYVIDAKISDDGKRILYRLNEPNKKKTSIYMYTVATNEHLKLDSLPEEFKEPVHQTNSTLLFLVKKEVQKMVTEGVDIWSYTDPRLQSEQLTELDNSEERSVPSIRRFSDNKVISLIQQGERLFSVSRNYALVQSAIGADTEWNWNSASSKDIYFVSLKDGSRGQIATHIKGGDQYTTSSYWILPSEKFVVYYNAEEKNYFSYEIASGIIRNISSSIKANWTTYVKRDVPMALYMPIGFAGVIENDEAVLVYDQHDIFQLDPAGKRQPINLTNGYGRLNNIELRVALEGRKKFQRDETVILSGFNRTNKDDGFYKINLTECKTPELLIAGPHAYKGTYEDDRFYPNPPIKAKDAEIYLVKRMSASESPNYFWTTDFKRFNRITDVHPEKEYNWLTTELITWKLPNGSSSQGILYKPENFDPHKKYPLIFHYYENLSEGLHGFLKPEVTKGSLNIPYYVSNGYLVFTPDIHYEIGLSGKSVVNTIVSAVDHLSKFSFVDTKRMGIQGHSRGGWETNFLITHTNLFAAAMSAAGFCNYTNLYNGIRSEYYGGFSRQIHYEQMYQRIGGTLWEKKNYYIDNSPIFKADKVITPLLMMNNKGDTDVPFEQGVQFFTALRRLGKRAWMLQYDGQRHTVNRNAASDLEIRMKQFFDHYLKDSACPRWMLYGVPASEKGNPNALQLVYEKDKNGKWLTPKEGGLLTEEERKKAEALKKRKPVTITFK